jgi:hypothetical protein
VRPAKSISARSSLKLTDAQRGRVEHFEHRAVAQLRLGITDLEDRFHFRLREVRRQRALHRRRPHVFERIEEHELVTHGPSEELRNAGEHWIPARRQEVRCEPAAVVARALLIDGQERRRAAFDVEPGAEAQDQTLLAADR